MVILLFRGGIWIWWFIFSYVWTAWKTLALYQTIRNNSNVNIQYLLTPVMCLKTHASSPLKSVFRLSKRVFQGAWTLFGNQCSVCHHQEMRRSDLRESDWLWIWLDHYLSIWGKKVRRGKKTFFFLSLKEWRGWRPAMPVLQSRPHTSANWCHCLSKE